MFLPLEISWLLGDRSTESRMLFDLKIFPLIRPNFHGLLLTGPRITNVVKSENIYLLELREHQ